MKFKSKFKKFLSSIAASMMIFGAVPKRNAKAVSDDAIAIGATIGIFALTGTAIAVAAYFENKAWNEEIRERERLINYEADEYIVSLARNLKTAIPRSHSYLFNKLVKCRNRDMLLEWQGKVASSSLRLGSLRKIKDCLYNHWLAYETNPKNAKINIYVLEERCKEIVKEEKFERQMQIERAKIEAKKNQSKIINQNNTNITNTNINNNNTNINNNNYSKNYNHNYNYSYSNNSNYNYNSNRTNNYSNNFDF